MRIRSIKWKRLIWTVLVSIYFIIFFRNMFRDALADNSLLALVFSTAFVLWMAFEYYFGSPFFQSGMVEPPQLWKGIFALFFYPFLGYCAADYTWTHTTQLGFLSPYINVLGIALFVFGGYLRMATLYTAMHAPAGRLLRRGLFQSVRHPRYLATLVQIVAIPLVFSSWLGLVLALVLGLPLILIEIRAEEGRMSAAYKDEFVAYQQAVPILIPRFGRR
jgi:protein-S-isoprenylcysteine O-methyltransferase Ste14